MLYHIHPLWVGNRFFCPETHPETYLGLRHGLGVPQTYSIRAGTAVVRFSGSSTQEIFPFQSSLYVCKIKECPVLCSFCEWLAGAEKKTRNRFLEYHRQWCVIKTTEISATPLVFTLFIIVASTIRTTRTQRCK